MKKTGALTAPYSVWMILLTVVPLAIVVYFAVTDGSGHATLANLAGLSHYTDTILRSLYYGLLATAISLVVSYPLAYFFTKTKASTQTILVMLIMIPMWMNFILRTYSIMVLFEDTGIINNFLRDIGLSPLHLINTSGAVVFGMVYNYIPFMVLPLYTSLSKLDERYLEAGRDLGCSGVQIFSKVMLPLTKSGILSGVTMVFVPSVSTFYISQKLGGGSYTLIGDVIELQFQTAYNYNLGAAISLLLMVLILISLAIMHKFGGSEDGEVVL